MIRWLADLVIVLSAACAVSSTAAFAQDVAAAGDGEWSNTSTRTSGSVPGSSSNDTRGSMHPFGSATATTATVSQNESAANPKSNEINKLAALSLNARGK